MRLTFGYMGHIKTYCKLLESLGHEVILPKKPTRQTIELGAKFSPEFVCFPFKCLLGTYIESIRRGAEAIVVTGGDGACRAGFYAELHQRILKSLGYDIKFYVFDSLSLHPRTFIGLLRELKGKYSWRYLWHQVRVCYHTLTALDKIQAEIRVLRAHEKKRGDIMRAWQTIQDRFFSCQTVREVTEIARQSEEILKSIPLLPWKAQQQLRIALVGEIYVTMEGHANMEIEEILSGMRIEVFNSEYVSHWLDLRAGHIPWRKSFIGSILPLADPYLKIECGGHEKQNIAHMIDFKRHGVDGIIHLMPFACLPELVTQSMIPRIAKNLNLPILSLAMDEQTGTVNVQTRLEAFLDVVRNRKRNGLTFPLPQNQPAEKSIELDGGKS